MAGADVESERAETTGPTSSSRLAQSSAAAFAQAEVRGADDRASLRAAVRAQRFATDPADLTPENADPWQGATPPDAAAITGDASASLALTDTLRLRGSWARGFRAPSLYERFGSFFSSFGYSIFGDPRLEPELTSAFDVGFTLESGDGSHDLRGTYFRASRSQIIGFGSFEFGTDPFGRFGGYENTSGGESHGAEVAWRFTLPGRTRARLQYTRTEADPPGNAPDELEAEWLVPRHQAAALLSGTVGERLRWSADWHLASAIHAPFFDSETFATRVFRFDGMRRFDVALSFDLGRGLTLRGLVQDAFDDAAYQSGGFRTLGRALRVSLRYRPQ